MLVDFIVVAQEHLVTHGTVGGGVRHRTTSLLPQRFRRWCRFIFHLRHHRRRCSQEELQDEQVRCFRFQIGDAHT